MTLTRPWAIDAAFPNAADQRKQIAGVYPREGVFPSPVTIAAAGIAFAGTGWGISARAFTAAIKRGGAPYSLAYGTALVSNDGTVANAWTIAAAPASGLRIDRLCIRARDTTQGDPTTGAPTDGPAGATRTGFPEFLVVTGTAATTPAAPALPAGYEEIARVTTPSGAVSAAGSTIVQTYGFAQVIGGEIYVRNATEMNALTNVMLGDWCYRLDVGQVFEYLTAASGAPANGWYPRTPRNPHDLRDMGGSGAAPAGGGAFVPIMKSGLTSGTTNDSGVLTSTFPTPFPNACLGVILSPNQITGTPFPALLGGTGYSASGFQTFWAGRGTTAVSVPYLAIGY